LLKNLSAEATVAGIVKNILEVIQTFENNSHGPHGGNHCFKALSKYCKCLIYPVCFEIFRFGACPLVLNLHSIGSCISFLRKFNNQQNAHHSTAVHYKHLRPAL